MSLIDDLASETRSILSQGWNIRDGQTVPETADVALAGGGVKLTPVMLYADLADSTDLASKFDRRVAAKVIKSFLAASCRIIRANDGHIRSFDGDRVMGVFVGTRQHTRAALSALQINYSVIHILRPQIEAAYPSLVQGGYKLRHGVGIDKSDILVTRSGIRNNNDLIWVGRAPNIAAKLAAIRGGDITSYMTKSVFDLLADDAKTAADGRSMWEACSWTPSPLPEVRDLYRSRWWKRPG